MVEFTMENIQVFGEQYSLDQDPEMNLGLAARDIKRRLVGLGYPHGKIEHEQIAKWREKMMEG